MILLAENPNQMFFTSRAELVRCEDLVRTVDEVVNQLDLAALYACWREGGRGFYDPAPGAPSACGGFRFITK